MSTYKEGFYHLTSESEKETVLAHGYYSKDVGEFVFGLNAHDGGSFVRESQLHKSVKVTPAYIGHQVTKTSFKDLISAQASEGNWNHSPYMLGLLNGLMLAESLVYGGDYKPQERPKKWLNKNDNIESFIDDRLKALLSTVNTGFRSLELKIAEDDSLEKKINTLTLLSRIDTMQKMRGES